MYSCTVRGPVSCVPPIRATPGTSDPYDSLARNSWDPVALCALLLCAPWRGKTTSCKGRQPRQLPSRTTVCTSSLEPQGSVSPFRVRSHGSAQLTRTERSRDTRRTGEHNAGCLCLGNSHCVLDGNPRGCKRRRWAQHARTTPHQQSASPMQTSEGLNLCLWQATRSLDSLERLCSL